MSLNFISPVVKFWRQNFTKFNSDWGSAPDPTEGAYDVPQISGRLEVSPQRLGRLDLGALKLADSEHPPPLASKSNTTLLINCRFIIIIIILLTH